MSNQVLLQPLWEWFMPTQPISSLPLSTSPCALQGRTSPGSLWDEEALSHHTIGKARSKKSSLPRLCWGLSQWSWEMHVFAGATAVKGTALGVPHSAEQDGSDFCPCTELPAMGQCLELNQALSQAMLLTVPAEAGTGFIWTWRCCFTFTKNKDWEVKLHVRNHILITAYFQHVSWWNILWQTQEYLRCGLLLSGSIVLLHVLYCWLLTAFHFRFTLKLANLTPEKIQTIKFFLHFNFTVFTFFTRYLVHLLTGSLSPELLCTAHPSHVYLVCLAVGPSGWPRGHFSTNFKIFQA